MKEGKKIAAIVATMGTTDAFGLDDLDAIVEIRDQLEAEFSLDYRPHIHADAVIGWAWSVFNDYDFRANPLGFPHRTVRALAGDQRRIASLGRADSIGIDFHKTGFTPYVSSLFLLRDSADFKRIARSDNAMPYLFQSGHYHPGKYTLETTRSGSAPLAAMANLLLFGKDGLRSLLGHLVTMAEILRDHLNGHPATTVLNRASFGPVTLFRVYPDGVDTFSIPQREADRSVLPRCSAKAQRLQPPHFRPRTGRRAGRAGDRDLDDRLLSALRLRRTDRRPQELHHDAVFGRAIRRGRA